MREWLGEHGSGDDDVAWGGVWLDGLVAGSTGEYLLEQAPDLGLKRDDLLVMDDRAAVEGKADFFAGCDRLFEELRECGGGWLVALRGGERVLQDEVEGAERLVVTRICCE